MKVKSLEALLRALERHPRVASFSATADGAVSLTFRDPFPGEPGAPAGEAYGAPADTAPGGDNSLDLPDGVFDPRRMIREINRRKQERTS